jgi:hypothetical protein
MTDNSPESAPTLENLAKRLENLESLVLTLYGNASFLEYEPFEGGEEQSGTEGGIISETIAATVIENAGLEQFIDGLGLNFFRGRELTPFWGRRCGNVRNSAPPRNIWDSIARTLKVLDRLRGELGTPITITSTYRNDAYNRCVGGETNSQHTLGGAIDFVAGRGTPDEWASKLRSYRGQTFTLPVIGSFVFRGGIGVYPSQNFVHIDTRPNSADWRG